MPTCPTGSDDVQPIMDGVAATEYIMAHCPTPILVVSSASHRGEVLQTFDALAAGAIDVLDKPAATEQKGAWELALVDSVKMVSRIRPIIRATVPGRSRGLKPAPSNDTIPASAPIQGKPSLIAIGASTGGPSAIARVLSQLRPEFPLPILLIIHIAPEFAAGLVQWIATLSKIPVRIAVDGETIPAPGRGLVIMAPPDRHLIVSRGRLRVITAPERHSCRPSIDVLFESVARECGTLAIGVLLTGMGKDGALGLLAIKRSGGQTIAQDEASSIVFGMPRQAIALDAAQVVVPLGDVAGMLYQMAAKRLGV